MEFTQTVSAPQSDVVAPPIAVKEPVTSAVAPVIEAPKAEEVKPVEEPKERDSVRFAALAKREREVVKGKDALKTERVQFETERKELSDYKAAKQEAKSSPLKALELLGVTYKELTDFIMNDEKPTVDSRFESLQEKFDRLQKEREEEKKQVFESEKAKVNEQQQQVLEKWESGVKEFVKTNTERYELINLYDQTHEVIALVKGHYAQTQKILTSEQAADLVEKQLEEYVDQAKQTKKYKAKEMPQPKAESKPPISAQPRNLNNKMTPSASTGTPLLTREERIKRAMVVGKQ